MRKEWGIEEYTDYFAGAGVDVIDNGVFPIGVNFVWHENLPSHVSRVTGHSAEHCTGVNESAAADDAGVGATGAVFTGTVGGRGCLVTSTGTAGTGTDGTGTAVGTATGASTGSGSDSGANAGAGSDDGFWNFSIVTPHGEKNRNPTNPTSSKPAITTNIIAEVFFAIFYLRPINWR